MGENKCSQFNCELDTYIDSSECILHCQKNNEYQHTDWDLYRDFNNALIENIKSQETDKVVLTYIIFPEHKEIDSFDYEKNLKLLNSIHFIHCDFHTSYLDLHDIKCFFDDCKFYQTWMLYDYNILKNVNNVIYQNCTFYKKTDSYSSEEEIGAEVVYTASQFDYTCKFEEELNFDNVKFKKLLFNTTKNDSVKDKITLKRLILNNCTFEQPFILNNYEIDYFFCSDTVFKNKSKFEFKNNEVEEFKLLNTNFKALVDCYNTEFESFKIKKSIFEKFTGFEQCKFGEKENNSKEAIFQYATFLDFVNFRDAEFHSGLDLRNANFKEAPNFLDVKVEPKNTSRETFRIIKHSFDSVGNVIEANKFFADEMRKEREKPSYQKFFYKLMLNLNYLISDFGQSWIRPLLLILYFLILQYLVFCLMDNWQISNESLRTIWIGINHTIHNFMPFKKFLVEGKEFVSLFFLIIYSILIYNLVISVKRITKR